MGRDEACLAFLFPDLKAEVSAASAVGRGAGSVQSSAACQVSVLG